MLVLDVLMRANDPVSFQMCPGIDCKCQNFLNPSAKVKPIATFCEKIWSSCVNFVRPTLLFLIWECYEYIREWIRSIKLDAILENYGENIWFAMDILSFLNRPNHALFIPITPCTKYFICQLIHALFTILFDLFWF